MALLLSFQILLLIVGITTIKASNDLKSIELKICIEFLQANNELVFNDKLSNRLEGCLVTLAAKEQKGHLDIKSIKKYYKEIFKNNVEKWESFEHCADGPLKGFLITRWTDLDLIDSCTSNVITGLLESSVNPKKLSGPVLNFLSSLTDTLIQIIEDMQKLIKQSQEN